MRPDFRYTRSVVESTETTAPHESGAPSPLDPLWERATEAWEQDAPHRALLEWALARGELAELAGRYRALREDPERGERAKRQLDAIVVAATSLMAAQRSHAGTRNFRWLTGVVAVLFFLAIAWMARTILGAR